MRNMNVLYKLGINLDGVMQVEFFTSSVEKHVRYEIKSLHFPWISMFKPSNQITFDLMVYILFFSEPKIRDLEWRLENGATKHIVSRMNIIIVLFVSYSLLTMIPSLWISQGYFFFGSDICTKENI